jgi:osmoprotectant transport system permease protein
VSWITPLLPLASGGPVIPSFGGGAKDTCVETNQTFCWGWAESHFRGTFEPALVQHVELTAIAVAIGFCISFGAALLAHHRRWFESPFAAVSAVLYTIPSLALFTLLIPITGLTRVTIEIPLVSYTLLILFRNTLAGLRGVPADAIEAARGMGLTPRQILWRVELPLAIPAIIAGLRIAVVTTISLATIAAIVIAQGLGALIFDGIATEFSTKYIAAGALAVTLALIADALLVAFQRLLTPWSRA